MLVIIAYGYKHIFFFKFVSSYITTFYVFCRVGQLRILKRLSSIVKLLCAQVRDWISSIAYPARLFENKIPLFNRFSIKKCNVNCWRNVEINYIVNDVHAPVKYKRTRGDKPRTARTSIDVVKSIRKLYTYYIYNNRKDFASLYVHQLFPSRFSAIHSFFSNFLYFYTIIIFCIV